MNDDVTSGSIDPEATEQQQADVNRPAPSPGEQLAAQRQALNWSIEQVANQLNLAPRQIQAIESDDYAALPGIAIVRGFIRAYAKLLKMDAAPLLLPIADQRRVTQEVMPVRRVLPAVSFSESRLPSSRQRLPSKSMSLMLFIGVVGAIFAGQQMKWITGLPESLSLKLDSGLALLSTSMQNISTVGVANTNAAVADKPKATASVNGINGTTLAGNNAAFPATPIAPIGIGGNDVTTAQPVATVSTDMAAPVLSPVSVVNTAIPSITEPVVDTKDMLVLKLREDSWIEIKKPDRSTLIARLVKAGTTETFSITGPVSLTVGNASGVDAILRGTPLALQSGGKSNVARLTLK